MEQIKALKELFESGALTKEEYEAKKMEMFQINLNSSTESLGETNCSSMFCDSSSLCELSPCEKQELIHQISCLTGDSLRDVFHIIEKCQPDLLKEQVRNEGDDFSFNVNSFSSETWFALQNYMNVFQEQIQVQPPTTEEQIQLQQIFEQLEPFQQSELFQQVKEENRCDLNIEEMEVQEEAEDEKDLLFNQFSSDTILQKKRNLDIEMQDLPDNLKKIRTKSPSPALNSLSMQALLTLNDIDYDEETFKLLESIFTPKNEIPEAGVSLGDLKPLEETPKKDSPNCEPPSSSSSESGKFKIKVIIYRIEKTCDGPYPYKCDNCEKRFSDSSNLLKHIRTHTKEKPYVCTVEGCNKEFSHSTSLKEHINTHSGNKPHLCPHPGCGMEFAHLSNLRRHSRIHTNLKPYVCDLCDHKFTQSSNWKKHLFQVHKIDKSKVCLPSTSKIKQEKEMELEDFDI